jgi:hypothetical protein
LISRAWGDTGVGFSEGGVGEEVAVISGGVGEGVGVTSPAADVGVISGVDVEVGSPGDSVSVGLGTGVGEGVELDSGEGEPVVVGELPVPKVGVDVSLGAGAVEGSVGNCEGVEVGTVVGPGLGGGAEVDFGVSRPSAWNSRHRLRGETSAGVAAA